MLYIFAAPNPIVDHQFPMEGQKAAIKMTPAPCRVFTTYIPSEYNSATVYFLSYGYFSRHRFYPLYNGAVYRVYRMDLILIPNPTLRC